MPKGKKAKSQSPVKADRPNVDTYLLAKHSGLFRPGVPFILAFAVPAKKKEKPK
jgi:hypothetical protein